MRKYFVLAFDSEQRGVHSLVPTYPVLGPSSFDSTQVNKCRQLAPDCLMLGQLLERPGKKVDLVGNPMGWPIVSPALQSIFEKYADDDIQCLPFNALDSSGKKVLTDYRVVNVLRCLADTVDLKASVTSRHRSIDGKESLNIITFAFRAGKIPSDVHVFRAKESMVALVVSQEFAHAMQEMKLKGFALINTGSV